MNQKATVEQLLKHYKWMLEPFECEIVLSNHYGLDRQHYDPSGEIADIQTCINGLTLLSEAWDIVLEDNIVDPEILQAITLPIQYSHGHQWVDPVDIRIACSFAVLVY